MYQKQKLKDLTANSTRQESETQLQTRLQTANCKPKTELDT